MPDSLTPTTLESTWITHPDSLDNWLQQVNDGDKVAMDTEFTRRHTFYTRLELLQLAHKGRYALVDPLAFDLGRILQQHLAHRNITCIMHSAGEDIETLAPWLPDGPKHLFDTQLAAAFAGHRNNTGYSQLVEEYSQVSLEKGQAQSNWHKRPLSPAQKKYAILDVVYLEPIHDALLQTIEERNYRVWFEQDCEKLKQRAHRQGLPDQPQQGFRHAAEWPIDKQAQLRRLLLWRERYARKHNKPRKWVLDNPTAQALIQYPPLSQQQLGEQVQTQRGLSSRHYHDLYQQLTEPVQTEEIKATHAITAHADQQTRQTIKALKSKVNQLAEQLHMDPGFLCSRKMLEQWLATSHPPENLTHWRQQKLTPLLASALKNK